MNIYFSTIRSLVVLALAMSSSVLLGQGIASFNLIPLPASVEVGEQVCIDFEAQYFGDLTSLQFGLSYDEAVLSFSTVESTILPAFTSSNYFSNGEGLVTLSYEPSVSDYPNGLELQNGENILKICFEAIAIAENSEVSLIPEPVAFEVYSSNKRIKSTYSSTFINVSDFTEDDCPFEGIKIIVDESCGDTGQNVCVDVKAEDFEHILSMQYSINYDPTALSFTHADDFLLPSLTVSNIANPYPGFITLSWISNDLIEGTSITGSEKIYELCFDIIQSSAAAATTYLSVGSTPTPIEVISSSEGEVDIWRVDGKIQINILDCENEGNPIDPVGFSLNEVEAYSGDNICVPVIVDDFNELVAIQFSMNYDESVLEYTGFNHPGILNLTDSTILNLEAGELVFTWLTEDLINGSWIENGSVIFELCFDVIGEPGSSPVVFSESPIASQVIDITGEDVSALFNNGTVNVLDEDPTGFILELSETCGEIGDLVCVDLTGEQLVNLAGMQFSVSYNENALSYSEVLFGSLPGVTSSNFNLSSPSNLDFVWLAPDAIPVTVENDVVLFSVCFEIISEAGSTVEIGQEGLDLEIIVPVQVVYPEVINGSVEYGLDCDNFGGLTIDLSVGSAEIGEEVCLDVKVYGFDKILHMHYGVEFDTTELAFIGVSNINLEELSLASFSLPAENTVLLYWLSTELANGTPIIEGTSVPDGTAIYQLCFEVVGDFEFSEVKFSDPYDNEIVDYTIAQVDYILDDGGVNLVSLFNSDIEHGFDSNDTNILFQNKPNPAIESTTVSFTLAEAGIVQFDLFKENGVLVKSFSNEYEAGITEIQLNDLNEPGLYYYTISGQGFSLGKRMIVVSE